MIIKIINFLSVEITNSTHALIIFKYKHTTKEGKEIIIDFWDTAGQAKFDNLHESYFFEAHGAILVFDTTRKITYKNLEKWYQKFRSSCPTVPCVIIGNKIDVDPETTQKNYALVEKMNGTFHLTSAADGTNVVKVRIICQFFIKRYLKKLLKNQFNINNHQKNHMLIKCSIF